MVPFVAVCFGAMLFSNQVAFNMKDKAVQNNPRAKAQVEQMMQRHKDRRDAEKKIYETGLLPGAGASAIEEGAPEVHDTRQKGFRRPAKTPLPTKEQIEILWKEKVGDEKPYWRELSASNNYRMDEYE